MTTTVSSTPAVPRCVCGWKNCRTYQKAFADAQHAILDGVVKIRFVNTDRECMELKESIDRNLKVLSNKRNDWKPSTSGTDLVCRYTLARHHFTEKHMLKYLQDPKSYSFTKPFSIHGAKKYLFQFNPDESFRNDPDGELLYLQTPNVTKEHVKTLYVMLKSSQKRGGGGGDDESNPTTATTTATTINNNIDGNSHHNNNNASLNTSSHHQRSQHTRGSNGNSNPNYNHHQSTATTSSKVTTNSYDKDVRSVNTEHLLAMKEEENLKLKDQLDSMQSQLSFLHDMVRKLQEEHFDHHSVRSGRSSRYTSRSRTKPRQQASMRSQEGARSVRSVGVPNEIELGGRSSPQADSEDGGANVNVPQTNEQHSNQQTPVVDDEEWSENGYDDDIIDDDIIDDDETAATFNHSVLRRQASMESNASKISRATTIASASKSVKSLPREKEIIDDEEDSSLEEEAFENRSLASSRHSRDFDIHHRSSASRGGSRHRRAGRRLSVGSQGGQSVASRASNKSVSWGKGSGHPDPGAGTSKVIELIVTDPYGEKGTYTGSISTSTGMPHGYGRLEYDRAGRWYEGDWKHGRWTGQGRLSNGDGDYYEGGLKNDHKHGTGIMKFADGRTFEGEYINGQMIEGKMTYQDGSTYAGTWVNGMRHGRGRCVFTDQSIYEGEFKEGEFFGSGKMSWSDGGWYEGEWWNGEMHGHGKEVRPDGSLRHLGDWNKGQPVRKNA